MTDLLQPLSTDALALWGVPDADCTDGEVLGPRWRAGQPWCHSGADDGAWTAGMEWIARAQTSVQTALREMRGGTVSYDAARAVAALFHDPAAPEAGAVRLAAWWGVQMGRAPHSSTVAWAVALTLLEADLRSGARCGREVLAWRSTDRSARVLIGEGGPRPMDLRARPCHAACMEALVVGAAASLTPAVVERTDGTKAGLGIVWFLEIVAAWVVQRDAAGRPWNRNAAAGLERCLDLLEGAEEVTPTSMPVVTVMRTARALTDRAALRAVPEASDGPAPDDPMRSPPRRM